MKYTCWLEEENDAGDDRRTREIEDLDEDYAAAQMCEALEQDGEWSGDPIPHVVIVFVQEESGDRNLFRVEVEHEYSVSFYAP